MKQIENNTTLSKTSLKDNIIEDTLITNPDKVIFPKPKITKLDIANYYHQVASRMLPFLTNRLISTIRAPEGINGDIFFKKHLETKSKGIKNIV